MAHHSIAETRTPATWQGPCAQVRTEPSHEPPATSWDLDAGDLTSWLRAARICAEDCPFLSNCVGQRTEFFPIGNPAGVIWAGVAYSDTGKVLDTSGLRRLSAANRNRHLRGKPRTAPVGAEAA